MSSGGHVESSSDCATRPKVQEIGLTGYAVPTPRSSLIGHCVMATAEHREPCDSRGSCTVLGAPGGEIPPGDSTDSDSVTLLGDVRAALSRTDIVRSLVYVGKVPEVDLGGRPLWATNRRS